MTNLKSKGSIAFLWDFTGKTLVQASGFIVTIILARLLEVSDFGLIAIAMIIIGIAGIFSDIGLGGAIIQRRKILPIHYSSVFIFNITIGFLLSIMTYIAAPLIATFFKEPKLIELTEILSVLFVLNSLNSVHLVKLRKEINYKYINIINITASILSGIGGVVLAYNNFGIYSLVFQQILLGVLSTILVWYYSKWRPSLSFSFKALLQLWTFGFRMFLSALIDNIFMRLDYIVIGRILDITTLGFFQRAKSLNMLVVQYSSASLMSVLFPVLSKIQKDLQRFQNVVLKGYSVLTFVVFMLLGILYLGAHEIIILLFGQKWLTSVEYFELLVFSGFSYPLSALLVNILSARGNSKAFLKLEIIKKLALGLNLYVGFLFGITGFLYGLILVSIWSISWNIYFARKEIKLNFLDFLSPIFTQISISVLSVLFVSYIESFFLLNLFLNLLFEITSFSIFYILINYIFKTSAFSNIKVEIEPIFKKIRKKFKGDKFVK